MDTEQHEIAANGTRLHVETAGAGDPVVLVHGFSLDTRMWDDQWAPFAERFHVIRYDLRGFGHSAEPTDLYYRHADDLAALLDVLEIDRAHIVGLSLGGGVTLDFAVAHPERARSIVTVDAILPGFTPPDLAESTGAVWRAARSEPLDAVKELWLQQPLFSGALADPPVAERVRQMVADYSGYGWVSRDPGRWVEPAVSERLSEITARTLAIVGEGDMQGFHDIADRIAAEVSGAGKAILPGCGHLPNMEAPGAFNATVLAFLAQA